MQLHLLQEGQSLKDTFLFFLGHLAFVLFKSPFQMFIFFLSPETNTRHNYYCPFSVQAT